MNNFSSAEVQYFFDRFVNPCKAYYLQQPNGGYRCVYEDLSINEVVAHLEGKITVGFPNIDVDGKSKWCCFDDDNFSEPGTHGLLEMLEAELKKQKYSSLREGIRILPDGRQKGGHLWIFFNEPVRVSYVRHWAQNMMKSAGIPANTKNLELFPKQSQSGGIGVTGDQKARKY